MGFSRSMMGMGALAMLAAGASIEPLGEFRRNVGEPKPARSPEEQEQRDNAAKAAAEAKRARKNARRLKVRS